MAQVPSNCWPKSMMSTTADSEIETCTWQRYTLIHANTCTCDDFPICGTLELGLGKWVWLEFWRAHEVLHYHNQPRFCRRRGNHRGQLALDHRLAVLTYLTAHKDFFVFCRWIYAIRQQGGKLRPVFSLHWKVFSQNGIIVGTLLPGSGSVIWSRWRDTAMGIFLWKK